MIDEVEVEVEDLEDLEDLEDSKLEQDKNIQSEVEVEIEQVSKEPTLAELRKHQAQINRGAK